jgi:hypothetical protein
MSSSSSTAGQTWPKKTHVATRCAYLHYVEGSNFLIRTYTNNVAEEHMLLDIPGERLADFTLAGKSLASLSPRCRRPTTANPLRE